MPSGLPGRLLLFQQTEKTPISFNLGKGMGCAKRKRLFMKKRRDGDLVSRPISEPELGWTLHLSETTDKFN